MKGVWWHGAQGLEALVFFLPPGNFAFGAWKTNSIERVASAGGREHQGRACGGREKLGRGSQPGPEQQAWSTRTHR